MKTKHLSILCLCLVSMAAQAQVSFTISTGRTFRQDSIDQKVLTVQYDMEALTDLSKPDQPVKETMRLDIGRKSSRFYSYTASVRDSVLKADMDNGHRQKPSVSTPSNTKVYGASRHSKVIPKDT